jgi:hypothetical protein
MDCRFDLDSRVHGLSADREIDVGFFGKLFGRPRISFTYEIVHDDEVDIPTEEHVSEEQTTAKRNAESMVEQEASFQNQIYKLTFSPHEIFREIPNLS